MKDNIKIYGKNILNELKGKDSLFLCVIASTKTSNIKGITGAGATPELTDFTPAADVELVILDSPQCLPEIPKTFVEGEAAPTPAVITKAALELTDLPFIVADAGAAVKPNIPYIKINDEPGKNIRTGKAVTDPKKIFEKGKLLGKTLSKLTDHIIIGESTPAGTTTALGVLTAMGYDARRKISGSMPENPHNLKYEVVSDGLKAAGYAKGQLESDPFKAVEIVGDPMIPAVAGITMGSSARITLAGGTQMTSVCAFIKKLDSEFDFNNICISTTRFVAEDETSDINHIARQIDDITIIAVDPGFENSNNTGLKRYVSGSVKEGVGAGGAMLAALLNGASMEDIRTKTEELCERIF
ncbi:MAG: TIGR00303 family protein [Methanobacteriaceae archaeon]|nr:TIGR00303 family protein [Methanobacteriaceae archaeon]